MASTTNPCLLLRCSLMFMVFSSLFVTPYAQVKGCPFNAIYSFGDGDASSTTSDGLLMVDHLAAAFHLPPPNPYMKPDATFDYGASFTAAGATLLGPTFFVEKAIQPPSPKHSVDAQLDSFAKLVASFCTSHENCVKKLQRAIFFVDQIGINDYRHAFLQGKSIKEVSVYVPLVVETIKSTLRKLIKAGAANLLVPGSPPMGCFPGYLTLFRSDDLMHYDVNNCHVGLNTFTILHNDHLRQALAELRLEFPRIHIVYIDYYKAFKALLRNHAALGFKRNSLMKACCGIGGPYNFHPLRKCGDGGVHVCSDPENYVHWDGFGLTREALKNVVDAAFSRRGFVFPEFEFPEVMRCVM